MAQYITTSEELKSVADAIRTKTKSSENLIWPEGYNFAINSISVGGPASVIKPLTITKNGQYPAPDGIAGYNPIIVNCPIPKEEQSKTASTVVNGQITVEPDKGKTLSQAIININVPERKPEETKTVEYTSNGKYTINPSTSDKVITSASITVAVPSDKKPEIAGNEIIKQNGKRTFTPAKGSVYSNFTVDVQTPTPKPEETRTVTISNNGTTEVLPTNGKVMSKVTITTNTPTPKAEQAKTLDITANGNYDITPDGGKVLNKATARVSIPYSTLYTGTGAPSNSLGVDGDIYFQK